MHETDVGRTSALIRLLASDPEQIDEWLDPEWRKQFGHRATPPSSAWRGDRRRGKHPEDDDDDDAQDELLDKGPITDNGIGRGSEEDGSGGSIPSTPPTTTVAHGARSPIDIANLPQNDLPPQNDWWDRTGVGLAGIGGLPTFTGGETSREENDTSTMRTTQRMHKKTPANTPAPVASDTSLLDTWERKCYLYVLQGALSFPTWFCFRSTILAQERKRATPCGRSACWSVGQIAL